MISSPDPIRSAAGRVGGYVKASRYPPDELTREARAAFLSKFDREADPDGTLPPDERRRRAEALRRAHYSRMALASAKSRRRRSRRPRKRSHDASTVGSDTVCASDGAG